MSIQSFLRSWPLMKLLTTTPRCGLEVAKKVDAVDDGDNATSTLTMILIDKKGHQRVRSLKKFAKDKGVDTLSIIYFLKPNDVKNTAFLTYDYKDSNRDDDQWLYLPALKKTKRIASTDKSGSFMGSDFSYADMTDRNVEDYNYKIKKETVVRGKDVWILEVIPKTQKTIICLLEKITLWLCKPFIF